MAPPLIYCLKCEQDLPDSEFYKAATNRGYQRWCKGCLSAWETQRVGKIFTSEDYEALLSEQGGGCAICKESKEELLIDKDSSLDLIRGLLCLSCRRGLDKAQFSERLLTSAAAYLTTYQLKGEPTRKERQWLYQCAISARRFSTCSRAAYYAVILDKNGHQLSQGWNGPPAGAIHCTEGGCARATARASSEPGNAYGNCIAQHAEAGAILRSDPYHRKGGTLVVNGPPCIMCSQMIAHCGIGRVVYLDDDSYRSIEPERDLLFGIAGIVTVKVNREDLH
jgi:deoxycytidylate deaminase